MPAYGYKIIRSNDQTKGAGRLGLAHAIVGGRSACSKSRSAKSQKLGC